MKDVGHSCWAERVPACQTVILRAFRPCSRSLSRPGFHRRRLLPLHYRRLKLHLVGPVSLLEAPAAGKVAS
jgi:hypothetical protein